MSCRDDLSWVNPAGGKGGGRRGKRRRGGEERGEVEGRKGRGGKEEGGRGRDRNRKVSTSSTQENNV